MTSDHSPDHSVGSPGTETAELISSPHSLQRAVFARRSEYIRPHHIRVKIGTWNVAASPGTDKDLASWFISGSGIDERLSGVELPANHFALEVQSKSSSLGEDSDYADDGAPALRVIGGDKIDLYVLGLQEVVDLNVASQYVKSVYADAVINPLGKWKLALQTALPLGYKLIASEQMSGLLLLVYASQEIAPTIGNVGVCSVGTGLLGYLGNKGAVSVRIELGGTTRMVFVNCHLASGVDASYVERRCWDVSQILGRTHFDPPSNVGVAEEASSKLGDEDFCFWFGDLNFRLEGLPGDDVRRLLMLHARGEYSIPQTVDDVPIDGKGVVAQKPSSISDGLDVEEHLPSSDSASTLETESPLPPGPDDFVPDPVDDPASLQSTLDSILQHDQLRRLMGDGKLFHDGWREGPIRFLPSYKYDVGTVGLFDSSEKKRAPSWCDRILFRTRQDKLAHTKRVEEELLSKEKDKEMEERGLDQAGDEDEVLFAYDPEADGDDTALAGDEAGLDYDEDEHGDVGPTEEAVIIDRPPDHLRQDIYTSHQLIQSSDHKPITSVFSITYDAIVPELKAMVHSEVARALDKAENEGQPAITIVADGQNASDGSASAVDRAMDFGIVGFLQKKNSSITIANTGRVLATFSFVETPTTARLNRSDPPPWLTVTFAASDLDAAERAAIDLGDEVTLEPGETVVALLEALVDDLAHARMLNDGQCNLEEILILRLAEGRDHFVPVRATWSPTCIGRSIDELIRVPDGGIRHFILSSNGNSSRPGSISYELDVHCAAPRELLKLTEAVDSLIERVLADEQMLGDCVIPQNEHGWPFENPTQELDSPLVSRVIKALDEDRPVSAAFDPAYPSTRRLEVVGHTLQLFLSGLTDGIISIPLWRRIEQASLRSLTQGASYSMGISKDEEDDRAVILDILASAPHHNISYVFLITTVARVIAELSPVKPMDFQAAKVSTSRGFASIGRRSFGFRGTGSTPSVEVMAAVERRKARAQRYAELFSKAICRQPPVSGRDGRERKAVEDQQRALLQLFLKLPGT